MKIFFSLFVITLCRQVDSMENKHLIKVLIADDNVSMQALLKTLLEKLGLDVAVAQNGRELLDLYEASTFNLLFVDIQMPVMDGYEATKRIRDYEFINKCYTPIIALTGTDKIMDEDDIYRAGFDALLRKPFKREEIILNLKRYTTFID